MLIETRREKRKFLVDYLNGIGFQGFVLENGKLYPADQIEEKIEDDIVYIHNDKKDIFNAVIA